MQPLIFDDSLAPITSEMAFLECQADRLQEEFVAWMKSIVSPMAGTLQIRQPPKGDLREVLLSLEPLVSGPPNRYLLIPTASAWTCLLDNGWGGTDANTLASYWSRKLGCRGLRTVAVPNTIRKPDLGRYGACIFELFGPGGGPLGHLRSITAMNDGGRWWFGADGDVLACENVVKYARARISERFTFEDLLVCAQFLGLRIFEEDFYLPHEARLIDVNVRRKFGNPKQYTLEEARAKY